MNERNQLGKKKTTWINKGHNLLIVFAAAGILLLGLTALLPGQKRSPKKKAAPIELQFDCGQGRKAEILVSPVTKNAFIETGSGISKSVILLAITDMKKVYGSDIDLGVRVKAKSNGGYTITVNSNFGYQKMSISRTALQSLKSNSCSL